MHEVLKKVQPAPAPQRLGAAMEKSGEYLQGRVDGGVEGSVARQSEEVRGILEREEALTEKALHDLPALTSCTV